MITLLPTTIYLPCHVSIQRGKKRKKESNYYQANSNQTGDLLQVNAETRSKIAHPNITQVNISL